MENIRVYLECGELKLSFEGSVEDVTRALMEFLSKHYPSYSLIKNLVISVDFEELLKKIEGVIGISSEGVFLLTPKEKLIKQLSLRERILLHLLKAHIGYQLKVSDKQSLSVDELLRITGSGTGALAGRLSELSDDGFIERIGRGEYKVTTLGLKHLMDEVLPKIKSEG
ncbi:MAG: hypothetical protein N3E48_02295 [Candidatus Bathyarchaeota archaeon]|nr:hypothetical protein [Candidatus Bathyarchaeota archaeon]